MTAFWIALFGIAALGSLFVSITALKRREETDDATLGMVAKLANKFAEQEKEIYALREELKELTRRVDDLPVEDLDAKFKAEAAWNRGVQEIVNFDINTAMGKGE